MSTVIMAACWSLQMPSSPKSVLISLADNANDHGECWPSITTICKRTCLKRTAVIEAIKWLEAKNLLQADRSNGRHTRYLLTPNLDLFDEGKPVRQTDQPAKRTSPPNGHNQSACRTGPVRQTDSNRQEPSRTVSKKESSLRELVETRDASSDAQLPLVAAQAGQPPTDAENRATDAAPHTARCPVNDIVALYHEILPMLPKCQKLTKARIGHIQQRWREDLQSLDDWRAFFDDVRRSPFLIGQSPGTNGRPPFRATLHWLCLPENFAKVYEGKYHQ